MVYWCARKGISLEHFFSVKGQDYTLFQTIFNLFLCILISKYFRKTKYVQNAINLQTMYLKNFYKNMKTVMKLNRNKQKFKFHSFTLKK